MSLSSIAEVGQVLRKAKVGKGFVPATALIGLPYGCLVEILEHGQLQQVARCSSHHISHHGLEHIWLPCHVLHRSHTAMGCTCIALHCIALHHCAFCEPVTLMNFEMSRHYGAV